MISWSYYGDRCAHYVFGAWAVLPYKIVFVLMHFLGAVAPLAVAWDLGDAALAAELWRRSEAWAGCAADPPAR